MSLQAVILRKETSPVLSIADEFKLLLNASDVPQFSVNAGAWNDLVGAYDFMADSSSRISNPQSSTYAGYVCTAGSVVGQFIAGSAASAVYLGSRSNHPVLLTVNNAEVARLTAAGVRIGVAGVSGASTAGMILGGPTADSTIGTICFGDGTGYKFKIGTYTGGAWTPRVTVLDTGRVGIGTSSPGSLLDIGAGSIRLSGNSTLSGFGGVELANVSGVGFAMASSTYNFYGADGSTSRLKIDSSGNVAVRATPGSFDLEILAASNGANCAIGVTSVYGNYSQFLGRSSRGTLASPSATSQNDALVMFGGRGYGATGWAGATSVAMLGYASESWTDSAQGAYWTIETTPNGSTGGGRLERLRVDQDGAIIAWGGPLKQAMPNGAVIGLFSATELLTVAAAATSDTVGNLLPAGAVVVAVTCRVTVTIPTATSFTLKSLTDGIVYTGAVGVAAGSTDAGVTHWITPSRIQSSVAQKIRLTITGSNPANNSGRVRITVYYFLPTPPTS